MSGANVILSQLGYDFLPDREWTHFECPFCHHHNQKFGVNIEHGGYNCFHCGEAGSLFKLLELVHGWDPKDSDLVLTLANGIAPKRSKPKPKVPEEVYVRTYDPDDVSCGHILGYFMSRKFSIEEQKLLGQIYPIYMSAIPPWQDRVIFEFRDEDDSHLGFIGRAIRKDMKPIRNQYGKKKTHLWGCEAIAREGERLVVVEGVFDALRVQLANTQDTSVVAICGGASSEQKRQLQSLSKRFSRVILMLDDDGPGMDEMAPKLAALVSNGKVVAPPGRDPADCTPEALRNVLEQV